ncbi:hypothetical protein SAMN05192562_1011102 [Kosakonia arachidis]|uniref:Uncharacterized protein n=1 Tax=Kosakonia arachidis TaxID=551989 RepID=A0A1I6ZDP5_9ENTR|nr:hypothetical protein SAMN05192562_1011102 [Kosakonia arachidis]
MLFQIQPLIKNRIHIHLTPYSGHGSGSMSHINHFPEVVALIVFCPDFHTSSRSEFISRLTSDRIRHLPVSAVAT